MDKIIYVSPIFSPSDFLFNKNLDSIKSFVNYISHNEFNGYAVFSGFCKSDSNWNILQSLELPDFIKLERLDNNYGKGWTVNNAIRKYRKDSVYLLTSDSDIVFPESAPNMFNRLINVLKSKEAENLKIGALALNQEVRCCHWTDKMNKSAMINNEELIWNNGPDGVAGGCIFMPLSTWDKAKGYRNLGVYSGDDAMLSVDIRSKGFLYPIIKSLSIIHPHNGPEEEKYQQWKVGRLNLARRTGCKSYDDSEFKQDVNEIQKFWENYD